MVKEPLAPPNDWIFLKIEAK